MPAATCSSLPDAVVVEHADRQHARARARRCRRRCRCRRSPRRCRVTCVPWPSPSCGVSSFSTKSRPGSSRPWRSWWAASTPVSITATTAPSPRVTECARVGLDQVEAPLLRAQRIGGRMRRTAPRAAARRPEIARSRRLTARSLLRGPAPSANLATSLSRFAIVACQWRATTSMRSSNRVVVFDGGMGATLEQFDLTEEDYGGLPGQVPRGARPPPARRDPGRPRVDGRGRRRGRRDRHLPGQPPQARRVGPRRAHARDQPQGRRDRPRGGRRGALRRRLDRPDRHAARLRRPDARQHLASASWSTSSPSRPRA